MASKARIQAHSRLETNARWAREAAAPLSVVMIGHRSASLLRKAVRTLRLHCTGRDWELVLVVNGADPAVLQAARWMLACEELSVAVTQISERRPGEARNAGVRVARAPLLFFLDDDIECFQNVVSAAVELFRDPALAAAGGPNLTPPSSGPLARATGAVMATRLGAAGMSRRYRLGVEGEASEHGLILCNLAVRRSALEGEHGFACNLVSNEENVMLQRLASRGARLWSSPALAVFHRRRDSWSGLARQAAKYGAGRAQNILLVPESSAALYFAPAALLYYTALSLMLIPLAGPMPLVPLVGYLALGGLRSLAFAVYRRDPGLLLGALIFPCVHLAYAIGFSIAFLTWSWRRELLHAGGV